MNLLGVSEEFLLAVIPLVFSGIVNVILAMKGKRVRAERAVAEDALRATTRRLLAEDSIPIAEVEELANNTQDPLTRRVMDRTMGVVISQSVRNRAFREE